MQTDEEVGKVAAAVPVIISLSLELFIESLITETSKITTIKNAKTLSTSHIKQTIETNKQFDFLRDLVANVPEHQVEDNNGDIVTNVGESASKKGCGRPRKPKEVTEGGRSRGESSKASSYTSEEEYDEEDDESTETNEEYSLTSAISSSLNPSTSSSMQSFVDNSQNKLSQSSLPAMAHSGSNRALDNPVNLVSHDPLLKQLSNGRSPTAVAPAALHWLKFTFQQCTTLPSLCTQIISRNDQLPGPTLIPKLLSAYNAFVSALVSTACPPESRVAPSSRLSTVPHTATCQSVSNAASADEPFIFVVVSHNSGQ